MLGLLAVPLLVILLAVGVPVAFSFALVTGFLAWIYDANLNTLMMQGYRSLDSVVLLALPLFIFTGYLMERGGIARRVIEFVGRIANGRSGMGSVIVLSSAIFGAIAGTASAAVASMGTIMSQPMEERGYPRGYTAALLGVSSLLGILIPPSITMILFAVVTRQSVAACFAASIGPALLLIAGLLIFNRVVVSRNPDILPPPRDDSRSFGQVALSAAPALSLPVIILGGIYGGFVTPTEAAAVASVASILIGVLVYRELKLRNLAEALVRTAETTGSIILILLFSFLISRIMASERVPQDLSEAVQVFATSPIGAILLTNLVLVVAGALMDDVSCTVVVAPLFLPLMEASGIDPVQYASIVACSVVIGANSPPMAPILYMACRVCRASVLDAVRPALLILVFVALPVMLAASFWPGLSLALPRWAGLL
jgi:tripartite ATP-independent transporter DctM subunit